MIEVHVAFPAVDERAGVEIFYATDAERVQVLGDWWSVIKGAGLPPAQTKRCSVHRSLIIVHISFQAQTNSGSLGCPARLAPFKRR